MKCKVSHCRATTLYSNHSFLLNKYMDTEKTLNNSIMAAVLLTLHSYTSAD